MQKAKQAYSDVLSAAIEYFATHGYSDVESVAFWSQKIREAAEQTLRPPHELEQMLREAMVAIYKKLIERGEIARYHPGIGRFTLDKVRPQLRAELDRRILAAASLIKINREDAISSTLRRFRGWSTSIPRGGSEAVEKRDEKDNLKKALRRLPFEERRVLIDQGFKLRASLSEILAKDGQAIAMRWRSHWRQAGYDYRENHKERDGKVYLLRNSWAKIKGFVKAGPDGYYDEITSVGEEVYCRCWAEWIYNLRDLPSDMITIKGREALEQAKTAA